MLKSFNATVECREVTCLYNNMNWMIEGLIEGTVSLEELAEVAEFNDYFF